MKRTIFISYSWEDTLIANRLDNYFASVNIEAHGFEIERDIYQKVKTDIRKFMQKVKTSDFVIPIISHNYLQSPNCMYEATEVLRSKNYRRRVIPIITDTAKIFTLAGKVTYFRFWEKSIEAANESLKTLNNLHKVDSIIEDIKRLDKILQSLDDFASLITDDLGVKYNPEDTKSFVKILDYIGFKEVSTLHLQESILGCESVEEQDWRMEKALIDYPNDKLLLLTKAQIKEKLNLNYSAIVIYEELIRKFPEFPMLFIELSKIYTKLYDQSNKTDRDLINKARDILEKGISQNPNDKHLESYFSIFQVDYEGPQL